MSKTVALAVHSAIADGFPRPLKCIFITDVGMWPGVFSRSLLREEEGEQSSFLSKSPEGQMFLLSGYLGWK